MTLSHAPFRTWNVAFLCRNPSIHTYCQFFLLLACSIGDSGWKQCKWAILKAKLAMRMHGVTWLGGRGSSETTYLESANQFAHSIYNFYGDTTTIKGSLSKVNDLTSAGEMVLKFIELHCVGWNNSSHPSSIAYYLYPEWKKCEEAKCLKSLMRQF